MEQVLDVKENLSIDAGDRIRLETATEGFICSGFFSSYDQNGVEVSEKLAQVEACDLLDSKLQKEIERLNQQREANQKAKNQLLAEIQLLEKKDQNGMGIHEKHALAQWCFLSHYSIEQFCKLYFGAVPDGELSFVFSRKCRELVGLMRKQVETSGTGKRTLCLYPENNQGYFPIEAYRVLCQRIGLRVNLPVFSWREKRDLESINAEYYERVSKRGRELFEKANQPKKECRKPRLQDSPQKMELVGRFLEAHGYTFINQADAVNKLRPVIYEYKLSSNERRKTEPTDTTCINWLNAYQDIHPEVIIRYTDRLN